MRLRNPAPPGSTHAALHGPPAATTPEPKRVLLVDDDEDTRESMAELLALLGHDCTTAGSGGEALAALDGLEPHVIFVDIDLPDMSGHELARTIRETRLPDVPIIAVSGRSQPSDIESSLEAGINLHLAKPIGCEALRWIVGDATNMSRRGAAEARASRAAAPDGARPRVRMSRGR